MRIGHYFDREDNATSPAATRSHNSADLLCVPGIFRVVGKSFPQNKQEFAVGRIQTARNAGELRRPDRVPRWRTAGAAATQASAAGVRWCRSPELHPSRLHRRPKQNSVRCTCGRSCAVAVGSTPRAEEWGSCETSISDKFAAKMMALRIADQWVFALALPRPPASRST